MSVKLRQSVLCNTVSSFLESNNSVGNYEKNLEKIIPYALQDLNLFALVFSY